MSSKICCDSIPNKGYIPNIIESIAGNEKTKNSQKHNLKIKFFDLIAVVSNFIFSAHKMIVNVKAKTKNGAIVKCKINTIPDKLKPSITGINEVSTNKIKNKMVRFSKTFRLRLKSKRALFSPVGLIKDLTEALF